MLNELLKFTLMDAAKSIEAGAAYDFFFKPFLKIRPFLIANKHIDSVYSAQRIQKLLEHHFTHKASSAC
jgi:hypothetical protein